VFSVFPLQRSADEWAADQGSILVSWALFNPNGPTISCIGLRMTGARNAQEVFYRWMHFLGGEDYCLGYIDTDDPAWEADLREIIVYALSLQPGDALRRFPAVGCIPSVVFASVNAEWTAWMKDAFGATAGLREADWGRECYFLKKYGRDLFGRAGEEVREAYEEMRSSGEESRGEGLQIPFAMMERIDTFRNWTPGGYRSRRMAGGDVDAWWSVVADADFRRQRPSIWRRHGSVLSAE
jgi:hypothetical protein